MEAEGRERRLPDGRICRPTMNLWIGSRATAFRRVETLQGAGASGPASEPPPLLVQVLPLTRELRFPWLPLEG